MKISKILSIAGSLFLVACASSQHPAFDEPACARAIESQLQGQSFEILSDPMPTSSMFRENKALAGRSNRFVENPKKLIGRKATILCIERVPNHLGYADIVYTLQVEGISETIYSESNGISSYMWHEEDKKAIQSEMKTLAQHVGKTLWSRPLNVGYSSQKIDQTKGKSIENLQPVTFKGAIIQKDDIFGKRYALVTFALPDGAEIYQRYEKNNINNRFYLNWHDSDPYAANSFLSEQDWMDIKKNKVSLGMHSAAVRLIYGVPYSSSQVKVAGQQMEQWTYRFHANGYKSFIIKNSKVYAIQN